MIPRRGYIILKDEDGVSVYSGAYEFSPSGFAKSCQTSNKLKLGGLQGIFSESDPEYELVGKILDKETPSAERAEIEFQLLRMMEVKSKELKQAQENKSQQGRK